MLSPRGSPEELGEGACPPGNQEGMTRGSPGVLGTQRTAVDTSVSRLSELRKGA